MRAGLLTGRYQQRYGHEFNPLRHNQGGRGQGLPNDEKTIADRLKAAHYQTAIIGKWHLGEDENFHPLNRGFAEFFGFLPGAHSYFDADDPTYGPIFRGRQEVQLRDYLTHALAKEAAAFIERSKQKPFFLYLAFNAVHTPMQAPDQLLKQFAQIGDTNRRTYLAMVAALDEAVGIVLDQLRRSGLEERTLIFFLSDNGGPVFKFAANGSRNDPLRGSKGDTWEGGIRVPFLAQWKGRLPAGRLYDAPITALDIAPTALALAQVKPRAEWHLDGIDLLPFLEGRKSAILTMRSFGDLALKWRFAGETGNSSEPAAG